MHDSLQYMSHDPVHRPYHHHEMTFSMVYAYSENYVLPISHDEVVHGKQSLVSKMPGDWWQQRANHRAYLGFMWAHPGKQLLFMGQEFAQGAEWSEGTARTGGCSTRTTAPPPTTAGVRDLVRRPEHRLRDTPALWQRDTDPAGFRWVVGTRPRTTCSRSCGYDADGSPLLAVSHFAPVVRSDYRLGVPDDVPGLARGAEHRRRPVRRRRRGVRTRSSRSRRVARPPGEHPADPAAPGDGVAASGLTVTRRRPVPSAAARCAGRRGAGWRG
ncbi:1,4-alpha-glucan branching enzyme GlgB [Streptomyces cyaneofuscatus]